MDTFRTYARKYIFLIAIVVVIILIAGAYELGFRVGPGGVSRVGTLTLTNLPSDTKVYVDQSLSHTVGRDTNTKIELVPGSHTIIISAPSDYPWSSVVKVASGQNTTINPFLVHTLTPVIHLTGNDAKAATAAVASSTLPTLSKPIIVANGCAKVYVANNQIIEDVATSTSGCTPPPYLCIGGSCAPTIIFAPIAPLSSVFAFPGRQDGLLVVFAGSMYALALDPTSPQFFAPLVRGTGPKFGQLSDGTIVVQDGQLISKLTL